MEIGALHSPLRLSPKKARVSYVDLMDKERLMKQYPELSEQEIIPPDIISDAENLESISDESMDFIVAGQVLEHLPNPIKALKEFYRVLKRGGILYLTIPDKRYSFDNERPVTSLSHLREDYEKGVTLATSLHHYQEWLTLIEINKSEIPVTERLKDLLERQYRIHFHVWMPESLLEILNYIKNNLGVYFNLEDYYYKRWDVEVIFILKKVQSSFLLFDYSSPLKEKYSLIRVSLWKIFKFRKYYTGVIRRIRMSLRKQKDVLKK